jgi:Uma2 family endonuclease
MAAEPAHNLLNAEEFLEIDFGPNRKAELDDGLIRMMAGGTKAHARIQGNIMRYLGAKLRGTGCRPYGSDMALKTGTGSVRYPDISVVCNDTTQDRARAFDQANVVFEVLSTGTAEYDQTVKLREYRTIAELQTIVFVDPETETVRIVQRLGPTAWRDEFFNVATDVPLPSLNIILPVGELFAKD